MKKLSFLPLTVLFSSSAMAALSGGDPCDGKPLHSNAASCVTVTAYRGEQPLDKVGSSVTVITRDEMVRRGDISAADALKRVPGVTLSRNGGFGSTSQLRLRGSDPGQVRVLIDGLAVNDAAMSDTSFDFATLTLDDIERIEVLRGPQSSLYGSDAIGGVINIITSRKRTGWKAGLETGTDQTYRENLGYQGGSERFYYGASAQNFRTNGFSRITAGNERDGTRIADIKANVGGKPVDNFSVDLSGGYSDARIDFDPSPTVDGPAVQDRTLAYGSGQAKLSLLDGTLDNTLKLGATRTERDFDEPLNATRYSTFDGTRLQASYQADYKLRARDVATGGVEWERNDSDTTATTAGITSPVVDKTVDTRSAYVQYLAGLTDAWTFTLGGRHDDHQQFGSANTYRLTTAYDLEATGTVLRASYGTGFKAPSLFQLFHPTFGTATLQPEESKGYDAGVEQRLFDDRLTLGATWFHNDFQNLIVFDTGTSTYRNVTRSSTEGVETTASLRVSPEFLLSGNYTWMTSEDEATHRALQRRPKHSLAVGADYDISPQARIGTQVRYVSQQWDAATGLRVVKPYTVVDLTGSYDINPTFTLYSRVINLFDKEYGEAARYNAPPMSAYVGVKAIY